MSEPLGTPDPSTEALAAWNAAMSRSYPTCDEALEAVSMTGRALAARLSQAEEALRFYADERTWDDDGRAWTDPHGVPGMELDEDRGQCARAALAASSAGETPE